MILHKIGLSKTDRKLIMGNHKERLEIFIRLAYAGERFHSSERLAGTGDGDGDGDDDGDRLTGTRNGTGTICIVGDSQ